MEEKKQTEPDVLRISIDLANNGVIIRNPDDEGDVQLVLYKPHCENSFSTESAHDDEYKEIGKRIVFWMYNAVLEMHSDELNVTGFNMEVAVSCIGR